MPEEDGSQVEQKKKPVGRPRYQTDRRILLFFSLWVVLAVVITIPVGFILGLSRIGTTVTVFAVNIISAFFLTGILSYRYNNKNGIIFSKRVRKEFIKISAASAPIFVVILFFFSILPGEGDVNQYIGSNKFFADLFGLYIGMFLGVFLILMMYLFLGFGMIAVLSVFIRRKTPDMLVEITKITPNLTESARQTDKRKYSGYRWLGWAYSIPDVLDTRTLTINRGERIKIFPRKAFNQAIKWQLIYGIVLIVYISFSPFLLDYSSMEELFSLASITTTFIPLFILPWFIYLRLDAKIQGPVRDFRLFDGLSSRMFQTIVAFGTMFLLIRLALRHPGFISVIYSMLIYSIFFVGGILIITFVYFNYFENDLVADIAKRYEEMKEPDS